MNHLPCLAGRLARTALAAAWLCAANLPALELGDAPQAVNAATIGAGPSQASATMTVDTQDRAAVIRFFQTAYRASEGVPMGWNGNVTNCAAGNTSQAYKDATLLRVNYFRAMTGLPGDVSGNEEWNRKCQEGALMLSAADMLSHNPPPEWACYTVDGHEAAGHANLSLGAAGPEAVDGYMDDAGGANNAVGHRRWILYPPQVQMGTGSVPTVRDADGQIQYDAADVLWVISDASARPPGPEYVAWPPAGYVPYPVLPRRSGRWSFSQAGADFSRARVFMECRGTNVPVTLETVQKGAGDPTLVWRPKVPAGGETGATYGVAVSNVVAAGAFHLFKYTVTVIDPDELRLSVSRLASDRILLSWPERVPPAELQENPSPADAAGWKPTEAALGLTNRTYAVVLPLQALPRFYRLQGK